MMMGEEPVHLDSKSEGDGDGDEITRTRIHVGGLGYNVTEDDLRKTFSALGNVESAEIVRTKGRSFAYLDFLPSSQKSLVKLFSTYNGCMWKGGRLRLEKAKEHYLIRLRREWTEDVELASNPPSYKVDVSENTSSFEKPKKLSASEKKQLKIFFPKLMKMKVLPFSGSGKHKYSFQRIEVPSLPIHFCDCDDHSVPSDLAKGKSLGNFETESVGLNQEELDMMKSVMNKLFERENRPKTAATEAGLVKGEDNSVNSIDDMLVDENKAGDTTDEDNLIINVVSGGNHNRGQETSMNNQLNVQESKFNKAQTLKHKAAQKMCERDGKKITPYSKKRKSPLTEESDGKEILSSTPEKKRSLQVHLNKPGDEIMEPESGTHQSVGKVSWSQKSTWRDLIGERGKYPFQISHIMSSVLPTKEEQPKLDDLDGLDTKSQSVVKHGNPEIQLGKLKELNELANGSNPTETITHNSVKQAKSESQLGQSKELKELANGRQPTEAETQNLVKHGNSEIPVGQLEEPKELAEAPPVAPNADSNKLARGASWKQKSSWTQLVVNAKDTSFSISQIIPRLTFEKQGVPIDVAASSKDNEKQNMLKSDRSVSAGDCSKALVVEKKELINAPTAEKDEKLRCVKEKNEVSAPTLGKKNTSSLAAINKKPLGDLGIGETCSFMRSDASMKEWMKTKTALTGSLKKKVNEK